MWINYLKTTLRNLLKNKLYTIINILGLCLGMSCVLLIVLYVNDELSYDTFHSKAARIYRVESLYKGKNETHNATSPGPLAQRLVNDFPEVAQATRVAFGGNSWFVAYQKKKFFEKDIRTADANFFDIFSHKFLLGNPKTALQKPNSVVLTETLARKMFARPQEALGKVLQIDDVNSSYTVTAVVADVPANAHFSFTALFSINSLDKKAYKNFLESWSNHNMYTYVLLKPGTSITSLQAKMPAFCKSVMDPQDGDFKGENALLFKALTDIHLAPKVSRDIAPQGNITYLYIFSAIALLVILIAIINYINLASARAFTRAKEVGIRKVMGSTSRQVIYQFMIESTLLVLLAALLSLSVVEVLMPFFNQLTGKVLSLRQFFDPISISAFVGMIVLVGVLSGLYPALVLSNFKLVKIIKGRFTHSRQGITLRKGLVVFQFAMSTTMIVSTLVVYHQLAYVQNKDLGFNKEQVVILPLQDYASRQKIPVLKQELEKYPQITKVADANLVPGYGGGVSRNTLQLETAEGMQELTVDQAKVGYDFFDLLDLQILQGRKFDKKFATDAQKAVIVNETLVKQMQWTKPLGKKVGYYVNDAKHKNGYRIAYAQVVGVVKDFHRKSLRSKIAPMVLQIVPNGGWRVLVKVQPQNLSQTMDYLAQTWEKAGVIYPFRAYYLDQKFAEQYRTDQKRGQIFLFFAGLAIFIACLGLFGLATFIAQQRKKEIGVRKVLGASIPQILRLMARDFVLLVILANLIAIPVAYWGLQDWLTNFAYRTSIPWYLFAISLAFTLFLSLLTISIQSVRAARVNPATVLKEE
ncbi:MAG TPA: hypothetical protein DCS93_15060 [Microscillaceae bacterium]|nr:hypothetical protein [Microscillaceae bacterium]